MPKLQTGQVRFTEHMVVSFQPGMKQDIRRTASEDGCSQAAYIRRCIRRDLDRRAQALGAGGATSKRSKHGYDESRPTTLRSREANAQRREAGLPPPREGRALSAGDKAYALEMAEQLEAQTREALEDGS